MIKRQRAWKQNTIICFKQSESITASPGHRSTHPTRHLEHQEVEARAPFIKLEIGCRAVSSVWLLCVRYGYFGCAPGMCVCVCACACVCVCVCVCVCSCCCRIPSDQSWSMNNTYHLNSFDLSRTTRVEATVASSNLVWCLLIKCDRNLL